MIEQLVRVYIKLKKLLILSNYHKINCQKKSNIVVRIVESIL